MIARGSRCICESSQATTSVPNGYFRAPQQRHAFTHWTNTAQDSSIASCCPLSTLIPGKTGSSGPCGEAPKAPGAQMDTAQQAFRRCLVNWCDNVLIRFLLNECWMNLKSKTKPQHPWRGNERMVLERVRVTSQRNNGKAASAPGGAQKPKTMWSVIRVVFVFPFQMTVETFFPPLFLVFQSFKQ